MTTKSHTDTHSIKISQIFKYKCNMSRLWTKSTCTQQYWNNWSVQWPTSNIATFYSPFLPPTASELLPSLFLTNNLCTIHKCCLQFTREIISELVTELQFPILLIMNISLNFFKFQFEVSQAGDHFRQLSEYYTYCNLPSSWCWCRMNVFTKF